MELLWKHEGSCGAVPPPDQYQYQYQYQSCFAEKCDVTKSVLVVAYMYCDMLFASNRLDAGVDGLDGVEW